MTYPDLYYMYDPNDAGTVWSADLSAQAPGAITAASLLALGITFTRGDVNKTCQLTASTMTPASSIGANDGAIGGIGAAWGVGLSFEETRTNLIKQSRALSVTTAAWTAGIATVTADAAAGPDGLSLADQSNNLSTQYSNYQSVASGNVDVAASFWNRSVTGTSAVQAYSSSGASNRATWLGTTGTTWNRQAGTYVVVGGASTFEMADGRSTPVPGFANTAINVYVDFAQFEVGKFPTEAIATTAASVARAGERMVVAGSLLVSHGAISVAIRLVPKGSSSQYGAPLRVWTLDATNYAEIDNATRQLSVVIGGVTRTLATAMTWAAGDVLDIFVAGGGSLTTTAAYRVNSGATTQLGTGAALGDLSPLSAYDLLCSAATKQFTSWVQTITVYAASKVPSWAA